MHGSYERLGLGPLEQVERAAGRYDQLVRAQRHRPLEVDVGEPQLRQPVDEAIGDDPLLHAGLLLYASDLTMADPVTMQHPIQWEDLIAARGVFGASLDHAFWLHQPVRMDRWLLHVGDAYYLRVELESDDHPVSLLASRRAEDDARRWAALEQLRRLAHEHRDEVEMFGYHDPSEFPAG